MGRETLARPSLHLRWRKRCCAKDLVRGASGGEARFCASRVLASAGGAFLVSPLSSKFGTTPAVPQPGLLAPPRYQRGTTPQYADAAVPGTGTIASVLMYRPGGGGGCGCTSKEMDPGSSSQIMHAAQRLRLHHRATRAGLFSYSGPSTMGTPWFGHASPPIGNNERLEACKHIRLPSVPESPDLEPSFLPYPNTFFCWITFFSSPEWFIRLYPQVYL
jgi:hypothetical protein